MRVPSAFIGKWRITHMDEWDQDFVDLVAEGHVTVRKDGTGEFQFGAVQGEIDGRIEDMGAGTVLGFAWEGSDELDPVCGRGWVRVDGGEMEGHLCFHRGMDSAFKARKVG